MDRTRLLSMFYALILSLILNTLLASALSAVEVIPHTYYQMVPACEPAQFTLEIKNPTQEKDAYLFSILSFANESTITPQSIVLDPQQSHNVSITITPTDCAHQDRLQIPFHIETTRTEQAFEIPLTLDIDPEGIPLIARGINNIITNYSENVVILPVINPAKTDITFLVTFTGENWTNITPSPLIVHANNASQVILSLKPTNDTLEGNHPIQITFQDTTSQKKYNKKINITLQQEPYQEKWFQKLRVTGYFFIALTLLFLSLKTVIQHYTSPAARHTRLVRAELRKQRITQLLAQRKARVTNLPLLQNKEKSIPPTVVRDQRQNYILVPKHSIIHLKNKSWKTILTFIAHLIILTLGTLISPFIGAGILLFLTACVFLHQFFIKKKFSLIIAHEEAVLETRWNTNIRKAILLLNTPVKKAKLTIKTVFLNAPKKTGVIFSHVSLTSNIPAALLKNVRIHAAIPVRWLARNQAAIEHITVWKWSGKEWLAIIPEITFRTNRHIGIEFQADTLGVFAFGIEKPQNKKIPTSKKNKENPGVTGYIALTTLLVLGVSLLTFVLPQHTEGGIPRQVWPQDTEKTINLSTYFHDPDGDTLHYSASTVQNIHADIINGFAILSPDQGFIGTRDIVFSARDAKNATVSSNTIKLIIQKSYIPKQFRKYVIHNFIALFFLVLAFTLFRWRRAIKKFLEK